MTRHTAVIFTVLALLCLAIAPAAATVVQSAVSFSPNPPLVQGGPQKAVATYSVIPSGGTTFSPNHDLQMQTGLSGAQWVIQVTVDGTNAARQTATGSAAFLNGALLSYPTTRDVGFSVTVTGTVPPSPGSSVLVLQVEELDNAGGVVPGSVLVTTQPVAAATSPPASSPVIPTETAAASPSPPSTPRASLLPVSGILTAGIANCVMARRDL